MDEFMVGDVVRIRDDSEYRHQNDNAGVIDYDYQSGATLRWGVQFPHDYHNLLQRIPNKQRMG